MSDRQLLSGRKAIVTGGASGIGEAIVKAYAREGAQVLVVDLPDSAVSQNFAEVDGVTPLEQDITEKDAPQNIVSAAMAAMGGFDVLVNNAGISMPDSVEGDGEELWEKTASRDNPLMLDVWPNLPDTLINTAADAEVTWLIAAITEIRSVRAEMNVPARAQVPLVVVGAGEDTKARLSQTETILQRLARLDTISYADAVPEGAVQTVLGEATLALPLADVIDVDAERARLKKDIGKVEGEIKKISGKLGNQGFLDKAPEAVIEENKARLADEEARRDKLADALARLG